MGTEAGWIPLVVSALGAGASAYESNRVANRQKEIATQRSRMQQRKQHEIDAALNDEVSNMKASNGEAERQKSLQDFMGTLLANRANATGAGNPIGGSKRYQEQSASTDSAIQNYGTGRADIMSRIAAPTRQRQNEAISRGRVQDVVNGISRDARAQDFLMQLRANNVRANPWVLAAAQVAQSAGNAMSSRMAPITMGDKFNAVLDNSGVYGELDDLAGRAQKYMESGIYGGT